MRVAEHQPNKEATFSYINFVLRDADKTMLDKSVTSLELVVLSKPKNTNTRSHAHTHK